jgi:hypothetical protein
MQVDCIDPDQVSDHRPPTGKQWFKIAEVALEALGRDKPQNRREATTLINELHQATSLREMVGWHPLWSQSN